MPVTFLVNRNVQGLPQFASNLVTTTSQITTCYQTIADGAGNIYTCGSYISGAGATVGVPNAVQGSAPTTSSVALPAGNTSGTTNTAYVIKYSSTGVPQWVWIPHAPATSCTSYAYNIALDPTGQSLYVAVTLSTGASVTLYNTATTGASLTNSTITLGTTMSTFHTLICKIPTATAGAALTWATIFSYSIASIDTETDYGLTVDTSGNLYVSGNFLVGASTAVVNIYQAVTTGNAFGSTVTMSIPVSIQGINLSSPFLIKYSSAGVPNWYTLLVNNNSASPLTGATNVGQNVVCDPTGAFVYMVGSYIASGAITLLNGSTTTASASSYTLPATSGGTFSAGFIVKYSTSNGAVLAVAAVGAGTGSSPTQTPTANTTTYGVTVAGNGNLYVCGQYQSNGAVLGISSSNGSTGTVTASTVALPATGANLTGYMIKFLPSLVPIYASATPNTTGTSPNSYMFNVAVDPSDVNVFVAMRYVAGSLITPFLGVISNITTTAGTGTTSVILPSSSTNAAYTNFAIIRYFLGNAMYADTVQNVATVTAPANITIDSSSTSVYLSASYINNGGSLIFYNSLGNAATQSSVASGVSLPGSTTSTSAFFLKMS
jgi:hypothetical protein